MSQTLKPIFCRVGSKRPIAKILLEYFPQHKTYVEPFLGGGAMFFAKPPSEKEVIGDLDEELMRDYELINKVSINSKMPNLDTPEKVVEFYENNRTDNTAKLYKAIIGRCAGFSSMQVKKNGKLYKFPNPYSKVKNIAEYKERLDGVRMYVSSYDKLIKKYDRPDTFFYLDPPYEKSGQLYKDSMIDYEEMANLLSKIKGKFMLSINDSPYIRKVFSNFNIIPIKVKDEGAKFGKRLGDRKELVITNYNN